MNDLDRLYFDKVKKAWNLYLASVKHLSNINIKTLVTPEGLEILKF